MQDWFEQAVRTSDAKGAAPIAGAPNAWDLTVTSEQWRQAAQNIAAGGGRLISVWASRDTGGENLVRAAFAAVFSRVQPMVFGETTAKRLPHPPALLPVFTHLALVLMLGIFIPPYLADWYRAAARLIGGQ